MRRMPPGTFGGLVSRIPRVELKGEQGWLTPLRPGACGWHCFRCRCGVEVSRLAKSVTRAVREGRVPRCSPRCAGVPAVKEVG